MNTSVLVVDDEPLALQMLAGIVKQAGCDVIQATNGEEALHLALQQKPFLIIADVNMPQKDGITFVNELRNDQEYGKNVSVILLTQDDSTSTLNEALQIGITTYLAKSTLNPDELKQQIQTLQSGQ